jgi:hypothetical protein
MVKMTASTACDWKSLGAKDHHTGNLIELPLGLSIMSLALGV